MYAIGKALQRLKAYHWKQVPIIKVYIYCDNISVVKQLNKYAKTKEVWAIDKVYEAKLRTFLSGFDYNIEARHVKGHTNGHCVRTKTNNWMDGMAREARENYAKRKAK
jgi:hypothetical protein